LIENQTIIKGDFMSKFLTFLVAGALVVSCASKDNKKLEEREHENIARDYLVVDASSNTRPGWIEDAEVWARNHSKDTNKFSYFSYETDPKVSRNISCNLAKANAKSDIAGEITTFIDKQLGASTQGNANIDENNPQIESLREYVENTLTEKIQALIHGAHVEKTYWEKRKYLKDKGAKKDFTAWTCGVFLRMPTESLKRAIDEAANHVAGRNDDPETKETVRKALKDASENFIKAKRGE
jgi:hypothetical protein